MVSVKQKTLFILLKVNWNVSKMIRIYNIWCNRDKEREAQFNNLNQGKRMKLNF